jgi:hypothetical protein
MPPVDSTMEHSADASSEEVSYPSREDLEASIFNEDDGETPVTKNWGSSDGLDQELDPATLMKGDKSKATEADKRKDREESDDDDEDSDRFSKQESEETHDQKKDSEVREEKDPIEVAEARVKAAQFDLHRKSEELKQTTKKLAEMDEMIKSLNEKVNKQESSKSKDSGSLSSDELSLNVDELDIDDGAKEYLKDMLDDKEGRQAVMAILKKNATAAEKDSPKEKEGDNDAQLEISKIKFSEVLDDYDESWSEMLSSPEFDKFTKENQAYVNSEIDKGGQFDPIPVIRVLNKFKSVSGKKAKKPPVDSSPQGRSASSPSSGGGVMRSRKAIEDEIFNED